MFSKRTKISLTHLGFGTVLALLLAACTPAAPSAEPTRAPAPTFTATPLVEVSQVDPNAVAATKVALAAEAPAAAAPAPEAPAQPVANNDAAAPAAPEAPEAPAPEPTPVPQNAEAVISIALMNVRSGPGINYALVGGANQGERFAITGKDPTGAWWEVDFNGQNGWLFGELVTVQNTQEVALAQFIPPSPVPLPTAVPPTPTFTPPPPPPAAPPPTAVPAAPAAPPPTAVPAGPKYEFNKAVVGKCDPQAGGTWFSGKTYKNGEPKSGYRVAFSYAADAEFVTNPILTGPHEGYKNWDAGYYSHIISAAKPRAGTWYVWVVDDGGQRISEIATWSSDGDSNTCNQAIVDFDSR